MRILLVVDDEVLALKATVRLLKGQFDDVLAAESADEAEALLESNSVTHLLVDRQLTDFRLGEELIDSWKRRWSTIHYAALMTGEDVEELTVPETVDDVFPKPFDMALLRSSLQK